ncbi:MAG TPA: Fic family protein [Terriglobia bacterium]|nr:Fic family protein [Terriglobia bacterium]
MERANGLYIHELPDWPVFHWDRDAVAETLAEVRHRQGRLLGRMEGLGFQLKKEAALETMTIDVVKTSEIEGERLDVGQVRSSMARRLGMDIAGAVPADRHVEGVVEMMMDATGNYRAPLSRERLFGWHAALFPTGYSGMRKIPVGGWRDDASGPMQVVSGPMGRERVHYEAPAAERLDAEMEKFIAWVNAEDEVDPVLKSAIAHLWFVTIHPFEDGNGRIARAIADSLLARGENSAQRFYSMSAQIRLERNAYYEILERTQKGSLDITDWLLWFIRCLGHAFNSTETTLAGVLRKARFWETHSGVGLNDRQRLMIRKLLEGFEGKLTSSKWAALTKCSQDTASRDIQDLIEKGIFVKEAAGGRSTSYALQEPTTPGPG